MFLQFKAFTIKSLVPHARCATKKAGGSTSNGRTSRPKFLGFKAMHNAKVESGNIIMRQRGTKWHCGTGVGLGKDYTIYATTPGRVVVHYDLERQRRLISVDEFSGTKHSAHFLPSRSAMKQRLRDSINVAEYLKLDYKGRYDYVIQKIQELGTKVQEGKKQELAERVQMKDQRKFNLLDLTML